MRYASVFVTILIVWVAVVAISALADDTNTIIQLHRLTMGFSVILFLIGFSKRK